MEILVLLLIPPLCACYTSAVASSKGHDAFPWAMGGLILGPLALIASLGLPDLKTRKYLRLLAEHHGVEVESRSPVQPAESEDLDAQRQRILGGKRNKG